MDGMDVKLADESATQALAQAMATLVSAPLCLTLSGTLGAGKTSFARAFIRALSGDATLTVASPTFLQVQQYAVKVKGDVSATLWHWDGYRIEHEEEILELGIEEMLEKGVVCIEWPEIFLPFLPNDRIEVTLEHSEQNARRAIITGHGAESEKVKTLAAMYHA
jgi:tRNA threonylcarbamoyl adenosine modification protein YjeE